jgi:hypothetical protein
MGYHFRAIRSHRGTVLVITITSFGGLIFEIFERLPVAFVQTFGAADQACAAARLFLGPTYLVSLWV